MSDAQLTRKRPQNPLDPIRIGVIGVGNMGQHHTRIFSLLKDVEFVGVSDVNVERGLDI
ncbi:MAG: gfo/Idh/MocA family oxidoreductase, partial [cyanobacterium endosymbiont of Rhopalodia inflata]